MEKRLVLFLVLSVLIVTGYGFLKLTLAPPPQPVVQDLADDAVDDAVDDGNLADRGSDKAESREVEPDKKPADLASKDQSEREPDAAASPDGQPAVPELAALDDQPAVPSVPQQWVTLGSFAPDSPYRLLVVLNNRGASLERVALVERHPNGTLRYGDLTQRHGYLGISYRDTETGCRVTVVGPGTPAADCNSPNVGILVDDVIKSVDEIDIRSRADLDEVIEGTKPGQVLELDVARQVDGQTQSIAFSVKLVPRPLELIQPDSALGEEPTLSYLLGIERLGNRQVKFGEDELGDLISLRNSTWKVEKREGDDKVVFRQTVTLQNGAEATELEFTKTFRLVKASQEELSDHKTPSYHLEMFVEIKNLGQKAEELAFNMDGPNGLPVEGWWYSNKIHPSWGSAGARDVIWRVRDQRHSLRSAAEIYKLAKKDPDNPVKSVLTDNPTLEERTFDYLGMDTQFFSAVMMGGSVAKPSSFSCKQAYSLPVGPVDQELKGRAVKTLNATYRYISDAIPIEPNQTISKEFHIFLGPKSPELLAEYGLSDIIEYGWFGWIAKPLGRLLHLFYFFVRNYGLAIILLTVLVRGCMFPIGRKAARNAQMMQELAPEIKKIKEKYKSDMEKQAQAQRELWKENNFNPLGGCWLMFLQLPIFIGLYRCLSVDIELRQASLIPGLHWCSNLAGPDMLVYWKTASLEFLTGETGWLGPYFNILPIVTIVLFLLQQKLFTPPATDDQTRMQQKMMKYMMIFMGVMFFKVPAGLCLYFIASSLWGIAERKLLPKPGPKRTDDEPPKKGVIKSLVDRITDKDDVDPVTAAKARRKQRRRYS